MFRKAKKLAGFTLIELLVAAGLVGVLSGVALGVINVPGLRAKSRDAQRASDLAQIKTALELYLGDNRRYPATGSLPSVAPGYMDNLPRDPLVASGHADYCYAATASGDDFILAASMELPSSAAQNPCSAMSAWATLGGSCSLVNCYGTGSGGAPVPGAPYAWVQIPPPPSGGITVTCSAFCASQGLSCKTGVCPAPCPSPSCSNNCSWNPPASQASHQIAEYHLYTESTGHSCGSCSWAFPIGTFPWGDLRPSWYTYYRGYCCCGGP